MDLCHRQKTGSQPLSNALSQYPRGGGLTPSADLSCLRYSFELGIDTIWLRTA
jgi:hypothetical protein